VKIVLVLLNGSEEARAALHHGVLEAALRGARLRMVAAWDVPSSILGSGVAAEEVFDEFHGEADRLIEEGIEYAHNLDPTVELETRIVQGQPAQVFLSESKRADLVVMARGAHGSLKELVVGSITRYMLGHALCPILVVRTRLIEE
jgi:nucleotide-binding universal stress UspA family protein